MSPISAPTAWSTRLPVALRAVELDLASRASLSHSIVRPAWFMQNFSETFVKPVNDEIVVPCGMGPKPLSVQRTSHPSRQQR
jgi:hypothetical protein